LSPLSGWLIPAMSFKCSQLQIPPVLQADIFRIFLESNSGLLDGYFRECPTTQEKGNVNRRKALYQGKKKIQPIRAPVLCIFL